MRLSAVDGARGRRNAGPRVALFTDRRDWHARRLVAAFAARGATAVPLRLEDAAFDTAPASGLRLPGFSRALPDAALVRTVSSGSFEAVTRRLGVLHALRELGVPVWNDARAVERCVDKSMTSFLIARAGLPTPPTWTVEGIKAATAVVAREAGGVPLVLKPLFGSQGRGLRLVRTGADLPPPEEVADVYHLQRFLGVDRGGYEDVRAFVVGGRALACMMRRADTWITNVRQGGRPEALSADAALSSLAVEAAATVGADFCGVDILRDGAGRAHVLEVNSMPAWSGLQGVTDVDIAGAIADGLLARLGADAGLRASA
jgi:RimK family alpha-L-glutamate ligase